MNIELNFDQDMQLHFEFHLYEKSIEAKDPPSSLLYFSMKYQHFYV